MTEGSDQGRRPAISLYAVTEWDPEEIVLLYREAGWWDETYDSANIPALIRGSHRFVVAVDERTGSAVGMGRTISDGVSDAYIQDLVVLRQYRRCRIGVEIVRHLLDLCAEDGIGWIGLIAEPGSDPFYERIGFRPMIQYIPMLYK